ncbi:MAG: DUF4124 domain-containing protein [Pseudomonadota bacterium]|jgi:hypothetical protein
MRPIVVCTALALLVMAGSAWPQQFYKWKDADGVTHYTTTPPPEGTRSDRVAVNPEPPPVAAAAAEPGSDVDAGMDAAAVMQRGAACDKARANLATLQNNPFVSIDKDGDGTGEMLTVEEHEAQLAIAREQVRTLCPVRPAG